MSDLRTLWVPLAVCALAVVALLVDVLAAPSDRPHAKRIGWIVAAGLAGIVAATFFVPARGNAAHGAYESSAWTLYLQRLFLAAGVLGTLGGIDDVAARTPRRHGEYWLTLLFSLLGMVILAGARDLLLLVVAFELVGVPLYVLAAYAKTDAPPAPGEGKARASEAALKLYLVGATSSAVTLFGLALVTGLAGTTRIADLGAMQLSPLASLGLVFVLAGVGYKIGMVPFHMWVPDTYQGARAPFVAFLSVAPKTAGIAVIVTVFVFGLGAHRETWQPALVILSLLSMGVGNLVALPQKDLRRLLGYSGIAQMGYVLVAVATDDAFGVGMALFFLTAYTFTNLGTFLVVHAAAEAAGSFESDRLAGLSRRSPGLAAALLCFLLSLAGIPFVVGFWAKLYVFLAAWRAGLVALVVAGIVLAVVALFYYLRVLRAAYMLEAADGAAPAKSGAPLALAVAVCVAAVVGVGLWPGPLVDGSMRAAGDLLERAAATSVATLR